MLVVDANVILRYLLNDVKEQAEVARQAIDAGAWTTVEVIAEVVYVLGGVYGVPRSTIARTFSGLCTRLECDRSEVLLDAIEAYGATAFDFVDCVLLATAQAGKADVLACDKKLARAIETRTAGDA